MTTAEITPTEVRRALRDLARDRSPAQCQLAGTDTVTLFLQQQGLPDLPASRAYALGRILTDLVLMRLTELRKQLHLESTANHRAAVVADFSLNHTELEAWSALYHIYLRPDLNLNLRTLTTLLSDRHRRTLQRRLQRGIASLTAHLFATEIAAAQTLASRRHVAPARGDSATAPAHNEDDAILGALLQTQPATIWISGPPGTGKSDRAVALGRRIADTTGSRPSLHSDFRAGSFAASDRRKAMRENPSRPFVTDVREKRHVHIYDGIYDPRAALRIHRTMQETGATGIITSNYMPPPDNDILHITCGPLSALESHDLLRTQILRYRPELILRDNDMDRMTDAAQGLYRAIRIAASQLRVSSVDHVVSSLTAPHGIGVSLAQSLWHQAWAHLTPSVRYVVGKHPWRVRETMAPAAGSQADAAVAAASAGLIVAAHDHPAGVTYRAAPFLVQYLAVLQRKSRALEWRPVDSCFPTADSAT